MQRKTLTLFKKILKAAAPPPKILVSDWADDNRCLPAESSAEPGRWRTDRAPYQRDIMNAVNDIEVEKVVIQSSSQVGKSEIILNIMGYYIDLDPGPMLLVQPTVEAAKDFSKERIAPTVRETETLKAKVSDTKSRDSDNTILKKMFPGGLLTLVGANSPTGLAGKPIRILMADEIDRYPVSAGAEGDPLKLAEKRTTTFFNKKKVFVSTPTVKGASRIEDEYEAGSMEKWCLACPSCGSFVYMNLYGMKFQYKKDEKGNYTVWDVEFQCPDCLEQFDELTWKGQLGAWIADNPEVKEIRSFKLNAFVSPWVHWEAIIKEWLEAKKNPEKLKVFVNTMLGESWEEKGEIENEDFLLDRREEYPADLPEGVLLLTAGVDVQDDRVEYEVVGWGRGEESWGIEYGIIMGDPATERLWEELSDKLDKVYTFPDGIGLKIACTGIDSGGHFTTEVYKFAKKNEYRRIFAVKGQGGPGLSLVHRLYRSKKENAAVFILGVDTGKGKIMNRLKIKEAGEGYCHFPKDRGYDRTYFQGLISERLVRRKSQGQIRLVWEKIKTNQRNEPLDVRNYAQGALYILNPSFEAFEKRLKENSLQEGNGPKSQQQRPRRRTGVIKKGI